MIAYITKYALTQGILELSGKVDDNYPNMFICTINSWTIFHGEGLEWHRTLAGAVARANELRLKEIKKYQKKIDLLSRAEFTKSNLEI